MGWENRCSGHQHRIQAVQIGDRGHLIVDNSVRERLHLVDERLGVAVPHDLVSRAVGSAVCAGYDNRIRDVVLVLHRALRAKYLEALVIAVYGLTAVVDHADRAVLKGQGDDGGVHVAFRANRRVNQDSALGINLGDLAARQEADHIEVVDHHIVVDTARTAHVFNRGRLRVAGADAQDVRGADLAGAHCVVNRAVVVVKAADKADLQLDAGLLHRVKRHADARYVVVNRLFAEDVLAGCCSLDDQVCVRIGGRADENRCRNLSLKSD